MKYIRREYVISDCSVCSKILYIPLCACRLLRIIHEGSVDGLDLYMYTMVAYRADSTLAQTGYYQIPWIYVAYQCQWWQQSRSYCIHNWEEAFGWHGTLEEWL